jgi:hypothetical protein
MFTRGVPRGFPQNLPLLHLQGDANTQFSSHRQLRLPEAHKGGVDHWITIEIMSFPI